VIQCPSDDASEGNAAEGDTSESESNETSILDELLNFNQIDLEKKNTVRPISWVRSINETGYVIIRFSQPVVPLGNATAFPNLTIVINGVERPAFEIKVVPGFYSKLENLNFDWEVVTQTATELHL